MNSTVRVYFDYAATTPVDDRVLDAMLPYFNNTFGNPSSIHYYGQQAEAAVEDARESLADILHSKPQEIVFTACGTESDNLALRGISLAERAKRGANHILISPVEHHAVSHTAEQLRDEFGFELEILPVDQYGIVDPLQLADRVRRETAIVSVIYANNEIGTVNPIADLGKVCQEAGIPLHTDAVQAAAYLPIDTQRLEVDFLSIGAHKFYGPKGVGGLFCREKKPFLSTMTGGGQESGRRAGTHNVPLIVGMASALRIAQDERQVRIEYLQPMRDYLIGRVLEDIPDAQLTGHPTQRLPNHASFVFEHLDGNALLTALDMAGFACSSGSACKTGDPEPSDVLTALGLSREWALGSLRVTLGIHTTQQEIDEFLHILPSLVEKVRALSN